jgi:hypothetical protein
MRRAASLLVMVGAWIITGIAQTTPPPPQEDCLLVNPEKVQVEPCRGDLWRVVDSLSSIAFFDNETDGKNAVALVQRYNRMCYIGRRTVPRYILHYWKSPTGRTTTISPEHCAPYDPMKLQLLPGGAAGWGVTDGADFMLKLGSQTDATAALNLAKQYTSRCTIGRDDFSPPAQRRSSRLDYWK